MKDTPSAQLKTPHELRDRFVTLMLIGRKCPHLDVSAGHNVPPSYERLRSEVAKRLAGPTAN